MNNKLSNALKTTKGFLHKHSPEILTGIGVTGMITSTVLAVKATPKALELIEDAKGHGEIRADSLPMKTIIKVAWKPYIPAIVTGAASVACIIGASAVNTKRNAALTTAYAISERALVKYRDKVIETIGEKKEKEIKEKVAQDEINEKPLTTSQVLITSKGNTLCMDSISGRYFRSDLDIIRKAVNEINRTMTYDFYVSLDEFYNKINLDPIKSSDRLGWNMDNGLLELEFSTCLTDNDEPCVVIDYSILPKYGFDRIA